MQKHELLNKAAGEFDGEAWALLNEELQLKIEGADTDANGEKYLMLRRGNIQFEISFTDLKRILAKALENQQKPLPG